MNRLINMKRCCTVAFLFILIQWSHPNQVLAQAATLDTGSIFSQLAFPSEDDIKRSRNAELKPPPPLPFDPLENLEKLSAAAERLPETDYDVSALSQALGEGIGPAFRFVRDSIRYEAYPGVLRGAKGAYLAHAANAYDRSLLLADLLAHQEIGFRFATCRLSRLRAEELFARIFENPVDPGGDSDIALSVEADTFVERLRDRARRDYAAIVDAFGDKPLPFRGSPSRAQMIDEIREHSWLQARKGERWVDLDTSFGDAEPGAAYCEPERVSDRLPDEAYQIVTVRIVAETLSGGSLNTKTAFEVSRRAADLIDSHVVFMHLPGTGEGGLPGALGSGIAGADSWTPMLWIDGETLIGNPISFADKEAAKRGRPPSGGLGDIFGSGGALGGPEEYLVAEWLEFEIKVPGAQNETVRRALIDRAGAAWRARVPDHEALRPLDRDEEGLIDLRTLHAIHFTAGPHDIADYLRLVNYVVEHEVFAENDDNEGFVHRLLVMSLAGSAVAIISEHLVVPSVNESTDARFYAASPRIAIYSIREQQPEIFTQIDLRRDRLRAVARNSSVESRLINPKIWFGVLEGALEHELIAETVARTSRTEAEILSTSGILDREGAVAVMPGSSLEGSTFSNPEIAARIAEAQSMGDALVIPRAALAAGKAAWWRISGSQADTAAVFWGGAHMAGSSWRPPDWAPWMDAPRSGRTSPPHAGPTRGGRWKRARAKVNEYIAMSTGAAMAAMGVARVYVPRVAAGIAVTTSTIAAGLDLWDRFGPETPKNGDSMPGPSDEQPTSADTDDGSTTAGNETAEPSGEPAPSVDNGADTSADEEPTADDGATEPTDEPTPSVDTDRDESPAPNTDARDDASADEESTADDGATAPTDEPTSTVDTDRDETLEDASESNTAAGTDEASSADVDGDEGRDEPLNNGTVGY